MYELSNKEFRLSCTKRFVINRLNEIESLFTLLDVLTV